MTNLCLVAGIYFPVSGEEGTTRVYFTSENRGAEAKMDRRDHHGTVSVPAVLSWCSLRFQYVVRKCK